MKTPDRPDFPECPPPALLLSGSAFFVSFQSSWSTGQGHGSLGGTRETVARLSIWERLGRALANAEWGTRFAEAVVVHFPRINSDHSPILLRWEGAQELGGMTSGGQPTAAS
ncbi:hypothetical protein LINPERHAP1_LOCUS3899 [Linum perenne]